MTATETVLAGRAVAEQLMVDTCTIVRPAPAVFNEATLKLVPAAPFQVYAGPCQVQHGSGGPVTAEEQAGDREALEQTRVVKLPVAAVNVGLGDVVTVTACLLDPSLVGRTYVVRAVASKSYLTARRLSCKEVVA